MSVGSSEHFTLPRVAPGLREVNSYLGWFGPASRAMQAFSAGSELAMKLPGVESLWSAAGERFVKGSTGGPDAAARAKSGSHVVAIAYDSAGRELSEVHVTGVDGYTFTGRMLAGAPRRQPPVACVETARSGRSTRSGSASSWRAAPGRASPKRAWMATARRQAREGSARRGRPLRLRLSRDPAARRRLAALSAAALLALVLGIWTGAGAGDGERRTRRPAAARLPPSASRAPGKPSIG